MRVVLFGAVVALFAPLVGARPSFAADELVWTAPRTVALLQAIRSAGDHGLDPDWYGVASLEKVAAAGNAQALSDAFVAYAGDLSTGRVSANRVDSDIDIQQRKVTRAELLKAAQGRLPGAAEDAGRAAPPARLDRLHPAARRRAAEARHDRCARAGAAHTAG